MTERPDGTVHPATDMFPLMGEEELRALADDIAAHGLVHPIVLHAGMVLDGRNRLRACRLVGVEPKFTTWEANGTTPTEWVIATNLHRRHLTPGQRAALGAELLPLLEAEARERQGRRTDLGTSAQICAEVPAQQGKASEIAAAQVGVSARSVETARYLRTHHPAAFGDVKEGRTTLNAASVQTGYEGRAAKNAGRDHPARSASPTKAYKGREATKARHDRIAQMARDGYHESAIAAEVGVGEQSVRDVLADRGIPTLAARLGHMRRFDDNKAMEGLVLAATPLVEAEAAINWDALDRTRFGDWEARLSEAIRVLTGLRNRLRKG